MLCPLQALGGGTTCALGQGVVVGAGGSLPSFLFTQSDLLREVIEELPSLHPVGTECLWLDWFQVHPTLSCSQGPISYPHISRDRVGHDKGPRAAGKSWGRE